MDENSPTSEKDQTPAPLETSEGDRSECNVDCGKEIDESIENIIQILPSALQTLEIEAKEETLAETENAEENSSLHDAEVTIDIQPVEVIKESPPKNVEDVVQPNKECVPPTPVEKMLGAALTGRKPRPPPPPKRTFTEQELIDLRTAFDLLDRDRDGRVTCSELQFMLKKLGIQVRDELIDDLLKEASQTGNGLIDEAEFLTWVGRIQSLQNDAEPASSQQEEDDDLTQDLIAAFRVFDRDGNGFITRDELQTAMDMIGEHLTENQLNELLSIADLDKDGRINYEEFTKLLL